MRSSVAATLFNVLLNLDMDHLIVWTIYDNPLDYPGKVVVRAFTITPGEAVPSGTYHICESIEQARRLIPEGLTRMPRSEEDHPSVVESYL